MVFVLLMWKEVHKKANKTLEKCKYPNANQKLQVGMFFGNSKPKVYIMHIICK